MRRKRTPFHDLRPPRAPAALRRRTLQAALRTAPDASGSGPRRNRPRLADRLWTSRPLRLAWALLMLVLVGANLTLERWVLDADRGGRAAQASHRTARVQEGAEGAQTLLGSRETVLRALLEDERLERRGRRP